MKKYKNINKNNENLELSRIIKYNRNTYTYTYGGILVIKQELINQGLKLAASKGITEITKVIIETYLKPKLEDFKNKFNENEVERLSHDFTEYIERSYKYNLSMSTIVFRNQQKTIDDLYIPLTVKKAKEIVGDLVMDKDDIEICIDEYKDEFIPKYRKVLLVDSAGMGKSTVMKYLYINAIRQNKGIPILIELRRLSKETSLIQFIKNEINGIRERFKDDDIVSLIERGDFIFFFDGYDEVNNESKKIVTDNIQKFISNAGNNYFIISSRDENELNSFGDFQRFDIKRLIEEEIYNLIYKYDNNGPLSKELVEKLKTENNLKMISEFLDNPLMVSLLYKSFEYKKTIPYKKHIFYRQVYDALFEGHDMSKGGAYVHDKRTKLDVDDFHKVMRYIGFNTLSKGIIYQKEELVEIINKTKEKIIGIDFKAYDLIYDLTHSVSIFKKEGNQYRWVHKSFQDYFAAYYICYDAKDKYEAILSKISKKDKINKYYNILDFCYDIDYIGFTQTIIYPILKKLEKFMKEKYIDSHYDNYDEEDIKIRKNILFNYENIQVKKISESEIESLKIRDIRKFNFFDYFFDIKANKKAGLKAVIINNELGICLSEKMDITTLIKLLNDKKSPLVYHTQITPSKDELESQISAGHYLLDDDKDNYLNGRELFNLFNYYFLDLSISVNDERDIKLMFNYEECMKLKDEIEKDISNDDELDFL